VSKKEIALKAEGARAKNGHAPALANGKKTRRTQLEA
jgi:hypothetical protein